MRARWASSLPRKSMAIKNIKLTQGFVAKVDGIDYKRVVKSRWYALRVKRRWYAARDQVQAGKRVNILLHRFLMGFPKGDVHHKDGDGLNCQRHNLLLCSRRQNMQGFQRKKLGTSSQYRGVCWDESREMWRATIKVNGRQIHLGRFYDELAAAREYNTAALKYFGKFAAPNTI